MRKALVQLHGRPAGHLTQEDGDVFAFAYAEDYDGPPVSLTLPVDGGPWRWEHFPDVFEGMLPEGVNRESARRDHNLEEDDLFGLLLAVGGDTAGAVQVYPAMEQTPEAGDHP